MSNVIAFPRQKRDSPPQTMEELLETVETTRKEHVEYIMDEALSFVFGRVYDEGFDLGSEDCLKTTSMLVEAFRSAMYKSVGIDHPFHDIAESVFNIVDEFDEDVKLTVDIKSDTE